MNENQNKTVAGLAAGLLALAIVPTVCDQVKALKAKRQMKKLKAESVDYLSSIYSEKGETKEFWDEVKQEAMFLSIVQYNQKH